MELLIIPFFAIMMAIKGGWIGKFNKKIGDILEGAHFSALLIALVFAPLVGWLSVAIGAAWWLGVRPSMGEEAGAIGTYKQSWGEYVDYFDRGYGIKKSIQRGAWFGVPLAIVTGFIGWIIAGLAFPVVYFISMSARQYFTKSNSWDWAEPLYGLCFGIAAYYYIMGM